MGYTVSTVRNEHGPLIATPLARESGGCCVSEVVELSLNGYMSRISTQFFAEFYTNDIWHRYQDIGAYIDESISYTYRPVAHLVTSGLTPLEDLGGDYLEFSGGFRLPPGLWQVEGTVSADIEQANDTDMEAALTVHANDPFTYAIATTGVSSFTLRAPLRLVSNGFSAYGEAGITGIIGVEGDSNDNWWSPGLSAFWNNPTTDLSLRIRATFTRIIHGAAVMTRLKNRPARISPSCHCDVVPMVQPTSHGCT